MSKRRVHDGRVVLYEHQVVLPTGERSTYEVDDSFPFAVAVLIVDDRNRVTLTRQYRYPLDRWILDLPGGAGDASEDPPAAAARECEEEMGLIPEDLVHLHTYFANPGRAAWPVHLYFCRGTRSGTMDRSDPSEQVENIVMPLSDLDDLVREGRIVDPSLLIARTMAGARGWLPPLA